MSDLGLTNLGVRQFIKFYETILSEHERDEEVFRLHSRTRGYISKTLTSIIEKGVLDSNDKDFLRVLLASLCGENPFMRANIQFPKDGRAFPDLQYLFDAPYMKYVADYIDVAVAAGIKQEAAIQDMMSACEISRRDVFRALKTVRSFRVSVDRMTREVGGSKLTMHWPDGHWIDEAGKLVRTP